MPRYSEGGRIQILEAKSMDDCKIIAHYEFKEEQIDQIEPIANDIILCKNTFSDTIVLKLDRKNNTITRDASSLSLGKEIKYLDKGSQARRKAQTKQHVVQSILQPMKSML